MKVIELLTKIANGEAPKNIKYNDTDYYLFDRKSYLTTDKTRFFDSIYFKELNDEVEITEDKKIRKIKVDYSPDIEEKIFYEDGDKPNHYILGDAGTELLINKINEIIDYLEEK